MAKCNSLPWKSVPHYAAIEPDGNGSMIVSYKSLHLFKLVRILKKVRMKTCPRKSKVILLWILELLCKIDLTCPPSWIRSYTRSGLALNFFFVSFIFPRRAFHKIYHLSSVNWLNLILFIITKNVFKIYIILPD